MKRYLTYSDEQLVEKVGQGDKLAFTELYNRYWTVSFLQINKVVKDADESLDLVHNIFEKLWKDFPKNIHNFQAYLYQTGRFASINFINSSSRKEGFLNSLVSYMETDANQVLEKIQYDELLDLLRQEIEKLSPRMKEIFIRARVNGEAHKEIAEDLKVTVQTIKTTVLRVTKILRKKIPYIKIFFIH